MRRCHELQLLQQQVKHPKMMRLSERMRDPETWSELRLRVMALAGNWQYASRPTLRCVQWQSRGWVNKWQWKRAGWGGESCFSACQRGKDFVTISMLSDRLHARTDISLCSLNENLHLLCSSRSLSRAAQDCWSTSWCELCFDEDVPGYSCESCPKAWRSRQFSLSH